MEFIPNKDYKYLLKQAQAFHQSCLAKEFTISILNKTIENLHNKLNLKSGEEISSLKECNEQLTNELELLTIVYEELKQNYNRLKRFSLHE